MLEEEDPKTVGEGEGYGMGLKREEEGDPCC